MPGNDTSGRLLGLRARALFRAAAYGVKRAIRGRSLPLANAADECMVLSHPCEMRAIRPIFWEAHLAKIRGAMDKSGDEVIRDDMCRESVRCTAVHAYWFSHAVMINGVIYGEKCFRLDMSGMRRRVSLRPRGPAAHFSSASLAATICGSCWFGHWLEDELPNLMLASAFAPPVMHMRPQYGQEGGYIRMLGLPEPARLAVAEFDRLLMIDEFAQNPIKTRRYHEIRKRLAAYPGEADRVFILRGCSGIRRNLQNEQELAGRLHAEGYAILDPTRDSAEKIVQTAQGASVVVSVEGSQLAHALYLARRGGVMVILNPPYRVHTTIADIGVFCGLRGGMFVCDPVGDSKTDFVADIDEVLRFIDHVERVAAAEQPSVDEFVAHMLDLSDRSPLGAKQMAFAAPVSSR